LITFQNNITEKVFRRIYIYLSVNSLNLSFIRLIPRPMRSALAIGVKANK
jgi:hypothetical protein